ncbi:MAG: hypothetical protein MI892_17200 [Desulfobacterales bacterium]|nr:hypothetical protein [Desulfobacterales bacterium]
MNLKKKIIYGVLVLVGIAVATILIIPKDQIKVSNLNWEYANGQYIVSFQATNNTQKDLEAKIQIKLNQRKFAAGSPKTEKIDIVGTITIWVPISAKQSITINETLRPQKPTFKIDFTTIDIVDIQPIDK